MISAGLCLALLWMSGCGQKGEPEKFTYFLFATPLKEHETWLKARTGFQAACSDYGLKCAWEGPAGIDTEMMEEVMETGILQKADAIITQGVVDPDMVREAQAQGIPVVLVDSDIPESDSFAYIGKNFRQQAEMLLEDIESRYGEDEHLVVAIQVAELGFQIAKDQIAAVEEVFSAHRGGYEIVSVRDGAAEVVFHPLTGRTHQLRVHSASPEGLNAPIMGDRLYGSAESAPRLMLHAASVSFTHPESGERITVESEVPFARDAVCSRPE